MKKPIYLDYAATTPVDQQVVECMLPYLTKDGCFGNPSSAVHYYGQQAALAVDEAREKVADAIHAQADDIIFTSGATESINMAIKGIAHFHQRRGKHIVTVKSEHKAVIKSCVALESQGYELTYLTSQKNGLLDLDDLTAALRDDTVLVSVMHVNNETGVVQDIAAIAEIVKARGIFFHVDAVQSMGKLPIDLQAIPVDLMSFSGHKIYAPKGVGVLYIRQQPRVRLEPLIHGAGQERGLRAGTLAVSQIVAIGEAFQLAKAQLPQAPEHYANLRQTFLDALAPLADWQINGDLAHTLPAIVSVSFASIDGEQLMSHLAGIAVSSGAACTTASLEPSYVLRSMAVPVALALSTLRLSFGRDTTFQEVSEAAVLIQQAIKKLR